MTHVETWKIEPGVVILMVYDTQRVKIVVLFFIYVVDLCYIYKDTAQEERGRDSL